ncbi:MAG: hydrogenase iron-sulfur subunit [Desulfocurvibacter africanus]
MPQKIGVYFDQSSVGQYLDLEGLSTYVKNQFGDLTPVVKIHPRLNSQAGRELIKADLESGAIDTVCVCGTSPRVDWDIFDFGPGVLVDRVNLREQCVMCYKNPDGTLPQAGEIPEDLRLMAQDYVKMGVTKLTKMGMSDPQVIESVRTILVLGGGWTGLTSALNAAALDYNVVLVEKEQVLGGYAAKMYKTVPLAYPYTDAHDTGIDLKIAAVKSHPKITIHTGTSLVELKGAPGKYEAKLANGESFPVGSVVLATGFKPLDPNLLAPLGYGKSKDIITTMQLEEMAKAGKIVRPSDGQPARNVVFVLSLEAMLDEALAKAAEWREKIKNPQPVGEATDAKDQPKEEKAEGFVFEKLESIRHMPFSNEVSTLTALKQARYVREFSKDAVAYVFYDHMMVPGINERYYKAAQDESGVMLAKGTVYEIGMAGGQLTVKARDTLLGSDIEVPADLVVLPTGMVPTTAMDPVLNLQYRQGPALPDLVLFDGFADSNYICFPYETRRTGIYAAGTVRQPMLMARSEDDANGATLKAIQCLVSANRGMAVHPRSGDSSYPKFNFVRCTQCKRCTEECPFGVLDDDEKGTPQPNPSRCRRCGTCMGACPERVISFDNYNVDMIGSMIKQMEIPPDMNKGGPRVLILVCENDAYPAIDMAAMRGLRWSPYVRFIPVRCLGSVNSIWIADAMSKGTDGVMLLGCKFGDDYQCHFVKGSELCNRRMVNIADSLKRLGVEPERVVQEQLAIDEYDRVPTLIDNFINYILKIGPNPFKGY